MTPASPSLVDVTNLAALTDIARRFHVAPPTVCGWRTRYPDFPQPVCLLGNKPIYLMPEVEHWYAIQYAARNT